MEMKIIQIGQPVLAMVREIQAVSENNIAIAFPEPIGMRFDLNQTLSVDLEQVDVEQVATNLTTGEDFTLTIPERDMHDTHLPSVMTRHAFPFLSVGEAAERQLSPPATVKPTVASPPSTVH